MNFFSRHRAVFGILCIALALAVTFGICFFALGVTAGKSLRLTVVIDAGHGGIDGGVVGVTTGVKESDVNLAVSRKLQTKFEEAGFRVVQTRRTEAGLYGTAVNGFKKRDMQKRAEIINQSNPALVISVHQNFFSLSSRRGAQVFFKETSEQSFSLACMIQTQVKSMPECIKQTNPLKGDYYILNCNEYPAVIVECGFLSNPEDEALLCSDEYQEKLVAAISSGALAFLSASATAK